MHELDAPAAARARYPAPKDLAGLPAGDLPVMSVDYRLAPEHPWPTAPDALGIEVTSLVLAGDSAGGKLAITTAMVLRDGPAAVPVIAHVPIYPAVDCSTPYPSFTGSPTDIC